MSKKKKSRRPLVASKEAQEQGLALSRGIVDTYEGQRLHCLLDKIWRSIELAKLVKGELPDKIWIKQQFAIGVNDVTRLLERMPQGEATGDTHEMSCSSVKVMRRASLVPLQVVIVAADCNTKWLTKHLPTLASSRKVPVILVRDGNGGSLRLGGLFKLKTALAIGVKIWVYGRNCFRMLSYHLDSMCLSDFFPISQLSHFFTSYFLFWIHIPYSNTTMFYRLPFLIKGYLAAADCFLWYLDYVEELHLAAVSPHYAQSYIGEDLF